MIYYELHLYRQVFQLGDISTIITSLRTGELYLGFVSSLTKNEVSSLKKSFVILNNTESIGMLIFLFSNII